MIQKNKLHSLLAFTVAAAALSLAAGPASAKVVFIDDPYGGGSSPAPAPGAPPAPPPPPAPTLTISPFSQAEADAGTNFFHFQIDLNRVVSGGVTFDIRTLTGTAGSSDFTQKTLVGQSFGATADTLSYTFSVAVMGDLAFEADEFFTVRLDNFSASGRPLEGFEDATGTIVNDDIQPVSNDVPEPASSALAGGALLALALARTIGRRKPR